MACGLFLEVRKRMNRLITSAQKRNWHTIEKAERTVRFLMFLMMEKILIIPLKSSTTQSMKTNIKINGNVMKNINPIRQPSVKTKT
jgi:hypothetical protein